MFSLYHLFSVENTDIISAVIKCADFKLPENGSVIDENGDCPYHLVVKSNKKDPIKVTVCTALSQLCPPLDPTVKDRPKKTKKKETQARMAKDYVPKEGKINKCLLIAEQLFSARFHHVFTSDLGADTTKGTVEKQYSSTGFSAEGHPVSAEGHPDSVEGHPVSTEGHPVSTEGHPVSAEEHPVSAEGHPVRHHVNIEEHPVSTEGYPVGAKGHPVSAQGHPVSTEEHSVSAEGHPVSAEAHSVSAEGHPASAEGHPVSAEGHPVSAKGHPVSAKGHPVSAEGYPVSPVRADGNPVEHPVSAEGHITEGQALAGQLSITDAAIMLDALLKRRNISMLPQDPITNIMKPNSTVVPIRNALNLKDLMLDSLSWEVEITEKVYAILKSMQPEPLFVLLKFITDIAKGEILKDVTISCSDGIELFYKKLHGCYILWEKATQYSPSITERQADSNYYYYVQVIRVWDVSTVNEDQLKMNIDEGFERVKKSYAPSKCANIGLFPIGDNLPFDPKTPPIFPQIFRISRAVLDDHLCDVPNGTSGTKMFLFACTRENGEYRAVPFYVLSSELVHTLQADCCHRCDFPPKPWPVEDRIVSIDPAQTVLLLGRSGTGKTTCCLNRLWNKFKRFWDPGIRKDCDKESKLRQIFVTKNQILRKQLKRKFYSFCSSYEYLKLHLEHEEVKLPLTLSEIKEHQYPLFLTSREFILLLDHTLPGESYFGTKDPSKLRVVNSDYGLDEDNHLVPELCDTAEVINVGNFMLWTEITAQYFVKMIWPQMLRKCHAGKELDPILVWMEINSFIKGSAEALGKGHPLLQEDYEVLGRKLAPNYADERPLIYELFKAYVHVRQNSPMQLFDECDLTQNLYKRLTNNKGLPCLLHCCYVDEVQDFTQGELMLILACCQDPNGHFFSGDTAQCIMSGVTFRFKDLQSIILNVREHTPDVHTLAVNFRSHDDIMKLAGSIIDLLQTFFKYSFDSNLPQDRGIMAGPTPVLLSRHDNRIETIFRNKDELPVLFEFEAHQVVIVRSKEARRRLPKALSTIVLTVFEAKGLEFDDVLLYNFFSDSLVSVTINVSYNIHIQNV